MVINDDRPRRSPNDKAMDKVAFSSYSIGVVALILVVICWVGSGFLTQEILNNYSKPFFLCYLTNLSYLLYFVFLVVEDPVMVMMKKKRLEEEGERQGIVSSRNLEDSNGASYFLTNNANGVGRGEGGEEEEEIPPESLPPLTRIELAKIALVFFALYMASNYATNVAFGATSVGSASILAATCGFFTLIFGWMMGVEVLSVMRVLAVIISVGGVLLLGIPELRSADTKALGNIMALVGAVLYGVFSIFLKRVAVDESRISMPLLFAFGGLYTLLFAWPILLGLHFSNTETFELPADGHVSLYLALNVFFGGFLPNYLWNVAFVCTSPLVVAIGISFTIPLTLLVEILKGEPFHPYRVGAGLCVVIGFVIVNLANIYPGLDLACERLLVTIGLMNKNDVKSSEERAAQLRTDLL